VNRLRRRVTHGTEEGMTLVELLVVMLILGVVGSVTSAAVLVTHKEQRYTSDESQGLSDVRTVVERLGRDIRQARSIDAGATSSKLVLWIDYNSDYVRDPVNQPDEIVTWQLQTQGGGSAQFNVLRQTTPTDVRVEARTLVSNISFRYLTAANTELPSTSGLTAGDAGAVTTVTADLLYNAVNGAASNRVTTFTERLRNVR
jgi:prepilin-type N-terminal cleavage/methylation domain-containing protein